jgi:homoserine O-succinyltransferase/O-acetyltransferase
MSLIANLSRISHRNDPQGSWRLAMPHDRDYGESECINISIINNMPDAAIEDTEDQYVSLLQAAAGDLTVRIRLYSLPEIARGDRARKYFHNFYNQLRDLPNHKHDALIITGTEPRESDLRMEAYWRTLTDLLDWAEGKTVSVMLSCLATHASVLHGDGIERHRLDEKRCGVFNERKVCDHPLMRRVSPVIRMPHSRWNDLRERDLASFGYVVLTKSREGGTGLFAKQKKKSLFVYSQGHPEYATHTLLKEYRRDIRRFIKGESETYPSMPGDYFDSQATELLTNFRDRVLADPKADLLALFPYKDIAETLRNGWHAAGIQLYRNWLLYVRSRKSQAKIQQIATASSERERRANSAAR